MKLERINVKLDNGAVCPVKAHSQDAGFDLFAPVYETEEIYIHPGKSAVIDTGVHMAIPDGYAGLIVSKSGLNMSKGVTSTGLIDAGYTGSIKVKLYNNGEKAVKIEPGNKISQIVVFKISDHRLKVVGELEETERGEKGFGSSGK